MKVHDILTEISWDPSMYKSGDENDPRSPFYDPRPARRPSRGSRPDPNELSDQDRAEDKYMAGVSKGIQRRQDITSYMASEGDFEGKPYNLIVMFNGSSPSESSFALGKWKDFNFNIYTKVVGTEQQGNAVIAYVDAAPQNLLWNRVKR